MNKSQIEKSRLRSYMRTLDKLSKSTVWKDVVAGNPPALHIDGQGNLSCSIFDDETSFAFFSREVRKVLSLKREDIYYHKILAALDAEITHRNPNVASRIDELKRAFKKLIEGDGSCIFIEGVGEFSYVDVVKLCVNSEDFHSDLKKAESAMLLREHFEETLDVIIQSHFINACTLMMHLGNLIKMCQKNKILFL